jgi:aminoglycoside phosphotransferase (APT) family kinase protein
MDVGVNAPAQFRSAATMIPQDWRALSRHLQAQGLYFDGASTPQQFAGGFGNLNYLIEIDGRPWVLRRPPLGSIPPGANDMAREHRVLSSLNPVFPLAPHALHFCSDNTVLGAPFLILTYYPGLIIRSTLPDGLTGTTDGPGLSRMLVRVLADLHAIDPASVGLADFGKPQGFLTRAVDGWTKRATIATNGALSPAIAEITAWLRRQPVPVGNITLLHNDFKLDNVILDPQTLVPRAVVDWDMGSRGDPLFDLATLLSYWVEPRDPPCMHDIQQMPTAQPGFWSRSDVIAAYAAMTGRDVSAYEFYRVLAMFKLGVVYLQLGAQWQRGVTSDPRFERFTLLGAGLLDYTHDIASGNA